MNSDDAAYYKVVIGHFNIINNVEIIHFPYHAGLIDVTNDEKPRATSICYEFTWNGLKSSTFRERRMQLHSIQPKIYRIKRQTFRERIHHVRLIWTYNLFTSNCEHFVNYIIHGRVYSQQIILLSRIFQYFKIYSINTWPTIRRYYRNRNLEMEPIRPQMN